VIIVDAFVRISKSAHPRPGGVPCWLASLALACALLAGMAGAGESPVSPPEAETNPGPSPNAAPIVPPAAGTPNGSGTGTAASGPPQPPAPAPPRRGLLRFLDPDTAPFIPIPEIDVDPNSGTTLGLIPTFLETNEKGEIHKIISPTLDHNPYFGAGISLSIYSFPSADTQWSVQGGAQQLVQRGFDYEFQSGRLRDTALSFNARVVYDRSGTPRFYGIGNNSPVYDETNYTLQQKYVQTLLGYNLTRSWQLAWVFRARDVDVQPGSLVHIESLFRRFGNILGVGVNHESLNRLEIIFDTRDDLSVPTRGGQYVLYGGVAARNGILDSNLYSATGIDARQLFPLRPGSILAAHVALRYMPGVTGVPFWSLSEIGGDRSIIGEEQPLRGFGEGRFYGRNSFDSNLELRERVLSLDAMSTHINVEVTPFIDMGEVFQHSHDSPVSHLHKVGGVGFRGVAAPFVVGFVDIGYGSEGAAVFTGINYPF
jgi:hypothetical protein